MNITHALLNRIILVTGANRGIGREVSMGLAAHGATVLLLGKNERALNKLYDEITERNYPEPVVIPFNLLEATPDTALQLANLIDHEFGRLDGLLHNAAVLGTLTPIEHYAPTEWLKVMQINLNAPFLLTQALIPLLKKSEDASIVFTSANQGKQGRAYWGAYGCAKFATEGLMQILSEELEVNTHIRVNSYNPVQVRTKLRATAYPGEDPQINPLPQALLDDYLTLLGPLGKHLNGQHIRAHHMTAKTELEAMA